MKLTYHFQPQSQQKRLNEHRMNEEQISSVARALESNLTFHFLKIYIFIAKVTIW